MDRQSGAFHQGVWISTHQLLDVIDRHGPGWPTAMFEHPVEAIVEAVGREIMAHNLLDSAHLSEQGALTLARLRSADAYLTGRLTVRRHRECAEHSDCWRIDCSDCDNVVSAHVRDGVLEHVVINAVSQHRCP